MNIARTTSVRSLSYGDIRTYVWSAAFVACNIVLPQLCHLVPGGGLTWLPIYFFTLVAAYKFGFAAGLLTALLSPLANNLMFGMPPAPMLPIILSKSVLLAAAAAFFARKAGRVALWAVAASVVAYQAVGTMVAVGHERFALCGPARHNDRLARHTHAGVRWLSGHEAHTLSGLTPAGKHAIIGHLPCGLSSCCRARCLSPLA